jgi:L-lactate dehydrogenase (cytochrome)
MMDGGIRRGGDVLKALALGARFVFAGRPFMYAAAIGGEQGVRHAITLLRDEVDRNMAMLGTCAIGEISSDCLIVNGRPELPAARAMSTEPDDPLSEMNLDP